MKTATDCTFLIRKDNKFLMQQRTDNAPRYPGAWCFPGEGIESGEDSLAAVIRGLEEEYVLIVSADQCQFVTQYEHDGRDIDDIFLVELGADQVPRLREGKAMNWKSLQEIKNLPLGFEQEKILSSIEDL